MQAMALVKAASPVPVEAKVSGLVLVVIVDLAFFLQQSNSL
jgi:hypothetical protein